MKRFRRWAALVGLVITLPTALAAPGLTFSGLELSGTAAVEGDAAALYFVLGPDARVQWDITATSGTLVRDYVTQAAIDTPVHTDNYLVSSETSRGREEIPLTDVVIGSVGGQEGGALLARSEDAVGLTRADGLVQVASVRDPRFSQQTPVTAAQGDPVRAIEERIAGEFLLVEASDATITIRGTITLDVFGPWYSLTSAGDTVEWRTGEFESSRTGHVAQVQLERHRLTLDDAVLHVRAGEPLSILTRFSTVTFDGALQAPDASGLLDIGRAILSPTDGTLAYAGAGEIQLAPSGGRIVATAAAPAAIATTGTLLPQSPPILIVTSALVLVTGAALVALVLWRRRERVDDMDAALLAMEERRWEDALPKLTRVARKDPQNAGVLVDRALCLEQIGRFEEAAKGFEAALRAAPRHAEAHFYYARTLAKMSEKEAARVHLETALERDPRLVELAQREAALRGL